jgi:short-subunit dehydrogenase involved in D-alanine esterification of teichoic acids
MSESEQHGKWLLILGSTGGSGGICTLEQALERGYLVTVCGRKTEKLPANLVENKNLTVKVSLASELK